MTVDPKSAAGEAEHAGRTYYFCCRIAWRNFQADPERYLRTEAQSPRGTAPRRVEIHLPDAPGGRQDRPGSCPKCGMALEPMQPTADEGPDPELVDMSRRFWIGAALTLPVFVIAMAGLIPSAGLLHWLHAHMAALNWVQLVLATPVVLWCGWPFFERAWASVVHRSPNMFTLIALGRRRGLPLQPRWPPSRRGSFPTAFASPAARSSPTSTPPR